MSISRHTSYNLLGAMLPLIVSLITIPVYIGLIGEERFGILAIVWLLVGYFGLFDLGLGRATAQRIAALRDANDQERAEVFWTALTMNIGLAIVAALLIWPLAVFFFENYFKVDAGLRPEILSTIPWLVLAIPMAIISGVLTGSLQGRERFLELNVISVFGSIFTQLFPLAVAGFISINLSFLLPAVLFARLLTMLALFERCRHYVIHSYKPTFKRKQARKLLSFGGWVTVTSLIGPLMVVFDRFIIGAISGAKMVTYYTVPFSLAERVSILPGSLASALFPRLASASQDEQDRLSEESVKILAIILTPLIIIGLFIMQPFLSWWLSPGFAENTSFVGQIFLVGFWVNSFARILVARLQAQGRPDLVAKCHLAELIPYLVLMYVFISTWGIIGASIAWSIRVTADFILLAALNGLLFKLMNFLIFPICLLSGTIVSILSIPNSNLVWLSGVGLLCVSLYWSLRNMPSSLNITLQSNMKKLMNYFNKDLKA